MEKKSSIIGGLILIAVGAVFLLLQFFPGISAQLDLGRQWPLIIVVTGAFFLLGALLGTPPLAIPGSIIAGIGGILYYQNVTGNWASWAFAWALIPGFVGIGVILNSLLSREPKPSFGDGVRLVVISLVMFVIFGAFFNGLGTLGRYWPALLILIGGWMLFRSRK
jgi:hypothetical protein